MKKNFIQLLLLCSLFFNISHASLITMKDDCHHETEHELVLEQPKTNDNAAVCETKHLCHLTAIIDAYTLDLTNTDIDAKFHAKSIFHTPPFQETNIKPPIV